MDKMPQDFGQEALFWDPHKLAAAPRGKEVQGVLKRRAMPCCSNHSCCNWSRQHATVAFEAADVVLLSVNLA